MVQSRVRFAGGLIWVWLLLFLGAFFPGALFPVLAQVHESPNENWLIESDGRIGYRIQLAILLPDGTPADDLVIRFYDGLRPCDVDYRLSKNMLSLDLFPAEEFGAFPNVFISARRGKFAQRFDIQPEQCREWAQDGGKLVLSETLEITVRVLDEDEHSVQGATVYGPSIEDKSITDARGQVRLRIPMKPSAPVLLRAASGKEYGGILRMNELKDAQLARREFEIPLQRGVAMTHKVVDEDGQPIPKLKVIAQPQSREIYAIGQESAFQSHSDENGSMRLLWIPRLPPMPPAFHGLHSTKWALKNEARNNEEWQIAATPNVRQRITGRVVNQVDGRVAGLAIQLITFDHPTEKRVDQLYCISDANGEFTAEVIPGAHYEVSLKDQKVVGDVWTGVIADLKGNVDPPQLAVRKGIPLQIQFTQGRDKRPVRHCLVTVKWDHRYFRPLKGRSKATTSLSLIPDVDGNVRLVTPETHVKVEVYHPDFQQLAAQEIAVSEGVDNVVQLHLE